MKYSIILITAIIFSFVSCTSQEQKDNKQIKETVAKYWKSVKDNNENEYSNLIFDSENYPGVISSQLYFLHEHYKLINTKDKLLKEIKIKDTVGLDPNVKLKYVQYIYRKENDTNNLKKPLIITLMFYKPIGLDKIYNPVILQNFIGWDK